jgi:hypothetical protein
MFLCVLYAYISIHAQRAVVTGDDIIQHNVIHAVVTGDAIWNVKFISIFLSVPLSVSVSVSVSLSLCLSLSLSLSLSVSLSLSLPLSLSLSLCMYVCMYVCVRMYIRWRELFPRRWTSCRGRRSSRCCRRWAAGEHIHICIIL